MTAAPVTSFKQPFEIRLPHLISTWTDKNHNERAHVVIAMPSGTRAEDVVSLQVSNGGTSLDIVWNWPSEMTKFEDPMRIFTHGRFKSISSNHPKYIALGSQMKKMRGGNEWVTAKLSIKLPRSDFELTDPSISGHDAVTYIDLPHANDSTNTKNTFLFMYDLVVKNKSVRPVYNDDVEVD